MVPVRAPTDTDGRARTDFTDYMGELPDSSNPPTNLAKFVSSMSPNGSFRVYGCDWTEPVPTASQLSGYMLHTLHLVIDQIYRTPIHKRTNFGNVLASHNLTKIAAVVDQQQILDMQQACANERNYYLTRPGANPSQVPTVADFLNAHQIAYQASSPKSLRAAS